MRYMMLYRPGFESDCPPSAEEMAAVGGLIEELARSGVLIATDGLQPSAYGCRVEVVGGDFEVIDGPFAETKEVIGGYAIMNARSQEHAIELAKRFLALMGTGQCEVRLMHDEPAYPPAAGSDRAVLAATSA